MKEIRRRNGQTLVLPDDYLSLADKVLLRHQTAFRMMRAELYYDDMCSKNVMVDRGEFVGLVDLDGVMYGDPLEAVGRILASYASPKFQPQGTWLYERISGELRMSDEERRRVVAYALLNRVYWATENGRATNGNTRAEVDDLTRAEDLEDIERLRTMFEAEG